MLALPPRRLPASVHAGDYLSAVARLEKTGPPASARGAYERALERWPDQLMALMGLGNTAYRAGDYEAAEPAFRRPVLLPPRSARRPVPPPPSPPPHTRALPDPLNTLKP